MDDQGRAAGRARDKAKLRAERSIEVGQFSSIIDTSRTSSSADHNPYALGRLAEMDVRALHRKLLAWGKRHFRSFPWRETIDPYRILLAEVMLHRTQAAQVVPIYKLFFEKYPDAFTLSAAQKKELQDVLHPLGLRWRTDLIHDMTKQLMERFGGEVPTEKSDLLNLPGVSAYIAGAVRCFAWNLPEPLLDTNTVRVVGRLFGLDIKDSSRRSRAFKDLLTSLLDLDEPRRYTYALLDLADQVCTARRPPACERCPLRSWCKYAARNRPELLVAKQRQ